MAVGLGFLAMGLVVPSYTFDATLLHALGQAYVDAGSEAEGAALLGVLTSLIRWMRGLNQMSSLLYQGCVGLIGLALIRSRTWRVWGWVGLGGALLALPAKLPLGLKVPTNAIWTGLAYGIWPVALGIGLLKHKGVETLEIDGKRSVQIEDFARDIVYFRYFGEVNTEKVLRLARKRCKELGISKMVVASETGRSALCKRPQHLTGKARSSPVSGMKGWVNEEKSLWIAGS